MRIRNLLILLLSLPLLPSAGQDARHFEQKLYDTYVDGNIKEWKGIIIAMKTAYRQNEEAELLYSICFAQYGYIGWCISKEMENEAKSNLKDAQRNTDELHDLYRGRHDILALQGALLGYRIALSKFNALYLGPKSYRLINEAVESRDTYFNCSLEMANMLFYTPGILGGSKTEAIDYYEKAVAIIENSDFKRDRNWIYIHTVLFLANAYRETGSEDLACGLYAGLLEYEPGANWIRDDLYMDCR
jgi:hypothetical protein